MCIERQGRDNGKIVENNILDKSRQKMASIALTFREKVERGDRNDLKKVKVTTDCCLTLYYGGAEFSETPLNQAKSDSTSVTFGICL